MPSRWHHGHSLASGAAVGVVLGAGHSLALIWLAFAAGAIVALVLVKAGRFVHWLERALARRFPL